jgi:hypothetical protein
LIGLRTRRRMMMKMRKRTKRKKKRMKTVISDIYLINQSHNFLSKLLYIGFIPFSLPV